MKLLPAVLAFAAVLAGCANVDPSAAERERNREWTGLPPHHCSAPEVAAPAAAAVPLCPA